MIRSDYPGLLWIAETAKRLTRYGLSITDLERMNPEFVEKLEHIARMEDLASANRSEVQNAPSRGDGGLHGAEVL